MTDKLTITPLGPHIGAVIAGVNLAEPLSQEQFEQLHRALLKYQVLFFRNQPITPRAQRALANRFGDLHIHPVYPHTEETEEIIVLDTHDDNPPDNDNWHTDVTFIETPPALAILAAKQLPPTGGTPSGLAASRRWRPSPRPCKPCWQGWKPSTTSPSPSRPIAMMTARRRASAGRRPWPVTRPCATR